MAYTTINKSTDHFITHLYSGNDSTNNQTSLGMTPDLVWVKSRNTGSPTQHYWVDKVRGDKKYISSNADTAEQTDGNTFDLVSGGFNLAGGNGWTNVSGRTYVAWNWKANGAGVSNTDGSITSTVSASSTSGFSIVKYTGTGSNATVGHGLGGAVPKMIIVKNLTNANAWSVYHASLGATKYLALNESDAAGTASDRWQDTIPTSSVFSIGTNANQGGSYDYIAYCFAEKTGFSKFGSYTGNGNASNAPFIYTGFKPAFVLHKRTDSTSDWDLFDNKRVGYNVDNRILAPNTNAAEVTATKIDLLSNGFKLRTSTGGNYSGTYIYMAFAEAPIVGSNNVPCTAR